MGGKIGLRCIENGDISMDGVFVPEARRLPGVSTSAARDARRTRRRLERGFATQVHNAGSQHIAAGDKKAAQTKEMARAHDAGLPQRALWVAKVRLRNR
jgi:hypothetical protein